MSDNDQTNLDRLIKKDQRNQSALNMCLDSANQVTYKLHNLIRTHPQAVAEFLNVILIKNSAGNISTDESGLAKGYIKDSIPYYDDGLFNLIERKKEKMKAYCFKGYF